MADNLRIELGYSCNRGGNHVDLYDVDECVCGGKANGRVYIEFDSYVSEAEADNIVQNFIFDQQHRVEAWNREQDNYWK